MTDQTAAIDASPRTEASSTVLQIAVLAGLAATGTLATNILLPSLPQMAASLNVTSAAVTSAITIFLAVFAVGQLAVGPISDRYGRRWPVLIGFTVFFAGSVWCALAADLTSLLIGRVIQAAGACATSVLSRAIARDMFSGAALARAMALIMGGLFSMFSAAPRILIEAMHLTPIQLGLFFAGTVLIVFAAGMLATRLAPRYGLDRSIRGGLLVSATGSIAMLLVALYSPTLLSYLGALSVFLLGMGIVNPLGTAQALSPFGDKAGAASALVGFWQMMTAAIGEGLAATISHEALFALGMVRTVLSLAAVGPYALRAWALVVKLQVDARLRTGERQRERFNTQDVAGKLVGFSRDRRRGFGRCANFARLLHRYVADGFSKQTCAIGRRS